MCGMLDKMKFYHKIYYHLRSRYLDFRLFSSLLSLKVVFHSTRGLQLYFSRLFSELKFLLPIFLLATLLVNLATPKTQFEQSKERALQNPTDSGAHAFLAQQLFATNQFRESEKEAELSGDATLLNRIQTVTTQPADIRRKILQLQGVVNQYPDYRDAYLELAILNWQTYRPFDTKKYLEKVLELDPNNEVAKTILSSLP